MTRRERVLGALSHKTTDRVPWNIELTADEERKVCNAIGIRTSEFEGYAGNHVDKAGYNIGGSYIEPGVFRDEYGVVWDRTGLDKDIGMLRGLLLPEPDLTGYSFPVPDRIAIESATSRMLENGNDRFKFGKIGLAYFERAWSLRGMENLLMDFYLNPEFVEALFDKILDCNLAILDITLCFDIDGLYFGDDYGQQAGMIMGPALWRRFIKPGLSKMFAKVKSAGKIVALHSCGDISEIYGDLIDIGLDVHQTFQPEIYDIRRIKREFGADLSFWGGISTQRMLPFMTPSELLGATKEIMQVMSEGGGFIAAPTHRVPADVPVENIIALVEYFNGR